MMWYGQGRSGEVGIEQAPERIVVVGADVWVEVVDDSKAADVVTLGDGVDSLLLALGSKEEDVTRDAVLKLVRVPLDGATGVVFLTVDVFGVLDD